MTDDERKLESLKLLRESSAWMVGVQTAVFGLLVTLLNNNQLALGSFSIKGAIIAFSASIVFAGIVLGAIPWVLTRESVPKNIRSAPVANWPVLKLLSIGWASGLQLSAFILGMALLGAAVIQKQFGGQ